MVSLLKPMQDGRAVEVSTIGREGIVTPSGVFGVERAIMESVVQIPAKVLCIRREDFEKRLAADEELSSIVKGYVSIVWSQIAQTAVCNAIHTIEARCSRWLLLASDNALRNEFPVTHDLIAASMGVRRASVSSAAEALRKAGLIHYGRGNVTVIDRGGLEKTACECFATIKDQFDELFLARKHLK